MMRSLLLVIVGVLVADAQAAPSLGSETPPATLIEQLRQLKPQRPGVIDVYALLVGADGDEDVFRKEVQTVRETLEARFDTSGRTVTLVNQRSAPQPEATLKSLEHALNALGVVMDRSEDILFLHVTTHGWNTHQLLFRHHSGELYGLTPPYLKALLSNARIDNRVVVVSACYSGGFVAPLANPTTIVITAADQSRRSYGCGNDSRITDFSRALYTKALMQTRSLPRAARYAQQLIHEQERATQREHSYPQMQVGVLMEERLLRLERRLSR